MPPSQKPAHKQSFHEFVAMIRMGQVARISTNDMGVPRIVIGSLFAIAA
jgi:hypothetical protein